MRLEFVTFLALARCAHTALVLAPPAPAGERIAVRDRSITLQEGSMGSIDSGAKIWDAGRALSTVIQETAGLKGAKLLELGAGTGIGGLTAAACGAAWCVLSDGSPGILPLLEVGRCSCCSKPAAACTRFLTYAI